MTASSQCDLAMRFVRQENLKSLQAQYPERKTKGHYDSLAFFEARNLRAGDRFPRRRPSKGAQARSSPEPGDSAHSAHSAHSALQPCRVRPLAEASAWRNPIHRLEARLSLSQEE